jgi:ATP-binding cassette subfamily C exporter for protease/lipase
MKPTSPGSELRDALSSLRQFFKRAVMFSVVTNMLVLAPTLYMLQVYGRVVNSRSTETLLMLTVLIIGIYVVMESVDWVRSKLVHAAGVRLDRQLGDRVFNATFEARLRNLPVGITPLNDLRNLRGFLSSQASLAIMDAPISLLLIVVIFGMSAFLGALVLVAAIAMLAVGYATERKTMPPFAEAQKLAMEAQRYASTTLKNTQVIEAMGMMGNIRSRWLALQREFLAKQAEASDHAGQGAAVSKFIQIAQSSMVLGFASWLILIGELDASGSAMIVAWTLSSRALAPLQQLIGQWKMVAGARDTYARLDRILTAFPVEKVGMSLPPPKGALSVETLVATAPGSLIPILRGVNFSLAAGQVLAVVGPSAAGKSTLARLLVGLWPAASGKVRLDGVDVYAWNKQELGPHIGYLPQDNELFDGTLAENIARFGDVDLGKVEAAARAIGLHEMITTLPDGYDTRIGGDSGVLSGGQRQRVALARAIYGDPQFIVLDEPNSSLDEAGEQALVQTLLQLKARGATLVVITHRTNVLGAVDRMLILQEGQMQAFGPRDEVLNAMAGKAKPAATAMPVLVAT